MKWEYRKAEFLAACEACKAIFWPTLGVKKKGLDSTNCCTSREDLDVYMSRSPLREMEK